MGQSAYFTTGPLPSHRVLKSSRLQAGTAPPMVVFGGSGADTLGAPGNPAEIAGWNRRYNANEIAPVPHNITPNFTQPPTCGTVVHNLTITKPTAMRPISGQVSRVRPSNHCPTSAPTIICA